MLKQLQRVIDRIGITRVATDLGYRSTTTIRNWFNRETIPVLARKKVEIYLKKQKAKK